MELVKTGNYIRDIESRHREQISSLMLGRFNVWQIYRNFIIYRHLEKSRIEKKKTGQARLKRKGLIKGLAEVFRKRAKVRDKVVLYSTSALYEVKSKEDAIVSPVLKKIAQSFGCDEVVVIASCVAGANVESADPPIIFDDIPFFKRRFTYIFCVLLLPVILRHYRILRRFSDVTMPQVARQLSGFLEQYCYYSILLKILKPKAMILYCSSYGSEAAIAVMKALDVKVYEYQHGQLFPEHYGYNFCQSLRVIKEKMILPDKMLIYGSYWKQVLLNEHFFDENYFVVCGHPIMGSAHKIAFSHATKNPIVVFSSGYAADRVRGLISGYLENSKYADNYQWLIKPHPRENLDGWRNFAQQYDRVKLTEEGTYDLLKSVKIVLTASPSILYESTYFGNSVYCFFPGVDIQDSRSRSLTFVRNIGEDFIDCFDSSQQVVSSGQFYEEFSVEKIVSTVKDEGFCQS